MKIKINTQKVIEGGGGTNNHSELQNLDYEHSGHTGFQRAGNYVEDNNYVHTDNNFSNEYKNKVDSLENYDDTDIKSDIANLDINKADKSEIPDVSNFITNSVNNLINYYLKSETYNKTEVNNLISAIEKASFSVVNELPVTGQSNVIYLVPSANPKTQNVKDEYIWLNNTWEQIGSTQVNLTGYATETWVNTQISGFLTQSQIQELISTALTGYALKSDIPTKTSDLTNDSGFITSYTETDPTVPSYVKNITQDDIEDWNNKSNFSGNYNDLTNKPTIPSEVTETTISNWGFTKNTGTYSKPSGGIPKSDLASAVQTSLGKADTALQSYTEQYTGTITGITMNGTSKGTSGVVDLGTVITQHQDISGKLDTSKVKNVNSTTAGDVYDVRYINTMIGNIESLLGGI